VGVPGHPGPPRDVLRPAPERPAVPDSRPLTMLAAIAASVVLSLSPAVPALAADTGGVAWTVQTVDSENGTGRGSFSYDLEPGATISDAMAVVNTGTVTLPLDVYAADAFTTAGGDVDLVADAADSADAGLWVSVATTQVVLEPGSRAEIPFTITVPADARPGDHAAGLVTSLAGTDASAILSVERRLGTRINLRVAGDLLPAAQVENVRASYAPSWNPFEAGTLTVDYALRNIGNTRLTGVGAIEAAGPVGLFASRTPAEQLDEVIPGSTIEVRRTLSVSALGWLSGAVVIDPEGVGLGAGQLASVVTEFSTPAVPWSLVVLLVVIAGLAIAAIVLVRRRRAPAPEGAAPSGTQGQQG